MSELRSTPGGVHDHGATEGAGLACPEYRIGECRLPSDTPADGLTADTIAARALYATGGNVPTPKAPIVDMFEEVRRWVASIGSTNLDIGRKVTKADALVVIDRILGDLR